ncbi:hypothetical protein GCK32_000605 [Trichostrongylus colubriformis]|uniref:Uncharacterized protein n=1 Tax=Trichostrongylus colubriformis TaxID=6319 RepID=A0AAN8FS76_TRICO
MRILALLDNCLFREHENGVDVIVVVAVVTCIFILPTIFFLIYRLHLKLKKKAHKRASRVSVVSITPMNRPHKSSIVLPPIRHVPMQHRPSNELSTVEAPGATTKIEGANSRRVSACYLTEMKLMDVGPLPHDQAVIDEQRERELEKQASLAVQTN